MSRRPDAIALVFGVLFAGWALLWGLGPWHWSQGATRWLFAGLLILAGLVGLVASVAAGRRRADREEALSGPPDL